MHTQEMTRAHPHTHQTPTSSSKEADTACHTGVKAQAQGGCGVIWTRPSVVDYCCAGNVVRAVDGARRRAGQYTSRYMWLCVGRATIVNTHSRDQGQAEAQGSALRPQPQRFMERFRVGSRLQP